MENKIEDEILKIIDWFKNQELTKITGENIVKAIYKLSILRVNLGQELAEAISDYDLAYLGRKVQYAHEWNKLKDDLTKKLTQKDMDSNTLLRIKEIQEKELEIKKHADNLKFLYDSSATFIMTLQTRLRQLENDRYEVKNYKQNNV
jgi:hypothetical protein